MSAAGRVPVDMVKARALKRSHDHAAAIDADNRRIRAELRDRLDRCDDADFDQAMHWLANEHPDAVNESLDEIGAPA